MTIPSTLTKRAIFIQEFRNVVETKNIFSPVATKLVSTAKVVESPYTTLTAAKAHTQPCKVPLGTAAVTSDEMTLDRYIGNAITDCKEELSYAKFDIISMIRSDLYASVMKRANEIAVTDFLADATSNATALDLSTPAKVAAFLIEVAATNTQTVSLKQTVDGATVVRAEKNGKPFVAAGSAAYIKIVSQISTIVAQSSLKGLDGGNMVETPYGVTIINMGSAATNPLQIIYGTAGALTMAYRVDQIEVDMGEMTSQVVYSGSTDLDISNGDAMLQKTWYMSAQTKGKNGIFANVATFITKRLVTA